MWVSRHMHPRFNLEVQTNYRERWNDPRTGRGNAAHDLIMSLITDGGGDNFLDHDFCKGRLPFLEDGLDLKGLRIWDLDKDFSHIGDNFKGMAFDYAEFWHSTFKEAVFYGCSLNFAEFYNCTFENCAFVFSHFVGARFEKCTFVNCDFAEPCRWEHGTFKNVQISKTFLGQTSPFLNCYFDDMTSIVDMLPHSPHFGKKVSMPKAALSGYFASFQSAYESAGAIERAMECYWQGRKAYTRHNLDGVKRVLYLGNELLTGYGTKPFRPLLALFMLLALATTFFSFHMPLKESIVFSTGGLFTFGAGAEHLKQMGYMSTLFYVSLSFLGITLTALFITTLANLSFREKIPSRTVKTNYP